MFSFSGNGRVHSIDEGECNRAAEHRKPEITFPIICTGSSVDSSSCYRAAGALRKVEKGAIGVGILAGLWLMLQMANLSMVVPDLTRPSATLFFLITLGMIAFGVADLVGLVGVLRRAPGRIAVRTVQLLDIVMLAGGALSPLARLYRASRRCLQTTSGRPGTGSLPDVPGDAHLACVRTDRIQLGRAKRGYTRRFTPPPCRSDSC